MIDLIQVDTSKPSITILDLDEHRVELSDDRLELLDLSEPVQLAYVNAGMTSRSSPLLGETYALAIGIG